MNGKLQIVVSGTQGIGKPAVLATIAKALIAAGFKTESIDAETSIAEADRCKNLKIVQRDFPNLQVQILISEEPIYSQEYLDNLKASRAQTSKSGKKTRKTG